MPPASLSLAPPKSTSPVVESVYEALGSSLVKMGPAALSHLRSRLRRNIRDVGLENAPESSSATWELEPVPLIISAEEWTTLEAALKQRARLVNAFLLDAYTRQEVLRQGILAPELILADPYYRRPCLGLEPDRASAATVLRFDLVKTAKGWFFTRTQANTPIGLSFAVQNRRFLSQEAGELYQDLPEHQNITNFPLQLLEYLRRLSPRPSKSPSMIVLTAGPRDPFYMEHSFLARKMGLPLAQGDDLLVLDNNVYFKTILGLERIDVIYRRLNDRHIDPVVFSTDRDTAGIPGLIQCIRSGNVVVANAIGAGLGESRALDAFTGPLSRFYLNERPIIPAVPTYSCADNDLLDFILDQRDSIQIVPVHDAPVSSTGRTLLEAQLGFGRVGSAENPLLDANGFAKDLLSNPHQYVARESLVPLGLVPGASKFKTHSPYFTRSETGRVSCFVLCEGRNLTVLPGALTLLGDVNVSAETMGRTTDTIVLSEENASGKTETELPKSFSAHRIVLGSHAAESLYWLGRYVERGEATARMLSILEDVALEEIPRSERKKWLPLWHGLLDATGHGREKITARETPQNAFSANRTWRMALDAQNSSSIYSSVLMAAENAVRLRDYVSPEAWAVVNRLRNKLEVLSGRRTSDPARQQNLARECVQQAMAELNTFLATAERTMLHEAGWYFLRLGLYFERAIMTCSTLRRVLGSPTAYGNLGERENPELSALLRMLSSQDAYRRIYQTRAEALLIADLFLRNPEAPRSLKHCVLEIEDALDSIQADAEIPTVAIGGPESTLVMVMTFLNEVRTQLNTMTEAHPLTKKESTPAALFADLLSKFYRFSQILSDHYFSHQARIPDTTRAPKAAG